MAGLLRIVLTFWYVEHSNVAFANLSQNSIIAAKTNNIHLNFLYVILCLGLVQSGNIATEKEKNEIQRFQMNVTAFTVRRMYSKDLRDVLLILCTLF